jgi:hypothetical protein
MNKFWLAYDPQYGHVRGGQEVNPELNGWFTYDDALAAAKKHLIKYRSDVYLLEGIKIVSFPEILDIKVQDLVVANDNTTTGDTAKTEIETLAIAA